ncbi:hypothetical protein GCM10009616_35110 [Microlunatus lacustris]
MTQHPGPRGLPRGEREVTGTATLARRVLEVYRRADEDLQNAVHDCLQAGMPGSVLLSEEQAASGASESVDGRVRDARPSAQVPQNVR